jgi:hypothetical protein
MSEGDPAARRYYPAPPVPAAEMKPISKWVWIASAVFVLLLCAAIIPVYRFFNAQWHEADPLIAGLHQKMAKSDDEGIFAKSDPLYQTVGRKMSDRLFDRVRDQLGAPQSSELLNQDVSADSTAGSVLTLTLSTTFDKGTGVETLKLHKTKGVYRMIGYSVLSRQRKGDTAPVEIKLGE